MLRKAGASAAMLAVLTACSGAQDAGTSVETPAPLVATTSIATTTMPPAPATSRPTTTSTMHSSSTSTVAPSTTSAPPSSRVAIPVPTTSGQKVVPTTVASEPRTVTFTIPLGTAARIDSGENVDDVLPSSVSLRVGDRLVLVNQDEAFHIYGPLGARSGETIQYVFSEAGQYQGFCTTSSSRTVTIDVVDR